MDGANHIPHADLLKEIEAFCAERKISRTAFGRAAVRDPRFVSDLAQGRECLPRTVRKVRAYMAAAEGAS